MLRYVILEIFAATYDATSRNMAIIALVDGIFLAWLIVMLTPIADRLIERAGRSATCRRQPLGQVVGEAESPAALPQQPHGDDAAGHFESEVARR